jgi:isopenicillin N synthase-like dioxygenase
MTPPTRSRPCDSEYELVPPIIDFKLPKDELVRAITDACKTWGAFVAVNHGVNPALQNEMIASSRKFFDLPKASKMKYDLQNQGTKWRGYMQHGGERSENGALTEQKEGLYLGEEHAQNNPNCVAGFPTSGQNVLPDEEMPESRGKLKTYWTSVRAKFRQPYDGYLVAQSRTEGGVPEGARGAEGPVTLPRIFHCNCKI